MIVALALAAPAPLPGWRAAGPERGHVIDVAVLADAVLASSRPGVLRADPALRRWSRDPRFPAGAAHLAAAADGAVWTDAMGAIWRVEGKASRVAALPTGGAAVDLSAVPGGVLVAVRGEGAGVVRVGEDGTVSTVLDGVDPWALAANGSDVWAGTLDHGLFHSTDGGVHFVPVADGAVSALALDGDFPMVAWADGRVTRGEEVRCTLPGTPASAVARVGKAMVVIADGAEGPHGGLLRCEEGKAAPVEGWPSTEDGLDLAPTGLWALPGGRLLMGTFRAGPAVGDAEGGAFARTGFRATLTSATATTESGQLIVALMSTGLFGTTDAEVWANEATANSRRGPVSDVMDLLATGTRLTVADFEGLTVGRGETWYRSDGVQVAGAGRANALVGLAEDAAGGLWGRDVTGQLWHHEPAGWTACGETGVLRFEGKGEALKVVTRAGYAVPGDCVGAVSPVWPALGASVADVRSDGRWAVGHGRTWHDGEITGEVRLGAVVAVATREVGGHTELLAAFGDGGVMRCVDGKSCAKAAQDLPSPVSSVGWLADGTVWAAEVRGTLLLVDPAGHETAFVDAGAVSLPIGAPGAPVAAPTLAASLNVPPWRTVGRPTGAAAPALGAAVLPTSHDSPDAAVNPGYAGGAPDERAGEASGSRGWKALAAGLGFGGLAGLALLVFRTPRGEGRRGRRRERG